jgi:hypothetical protein
MMSDGGDALVWVVRRHVFEVIVARGVPPNAEEIAATLDLPIVTARDVFRRLHERHALFLEPDGATVRMAHPFSGVATGFSVHSGGVGYWANCAWDALGIPAALGADAVVDAYYAEDGQQARIEVTGGQMRGEGFVHFPLPFRRWYDDLVFT